MIIFLHFREDCRLLIRSLRQNYVVQTRHKTACFQDGDITIITIYH